MRRYCYCNNGSLTVAESTKLKVHKKIVISIVLLLKMQRYCYCNNGSVTVTEITKLKVQNEVMKMQRNCVEST